MEKIKLPNYSYVTIYKIKKSEISKIDFVLCNQPVETLESFYKRQTTKPNILFNGGLFSLSNGNTYFTYRDENKTISYMDKYTEGFGITDKGILQYGNYGKDGVNYKDFICGYPVLIRNSKVYNSNIGKELDYNTRRTVLAYDDNYIYVLIVELPGLNFSKLKTILLDLKVKEAINLDGGGSTRLLYNGNRESSNTSSRAIDNVVVIYFNNTTSSNNYNSLVVIKPYLLQKGSKGNAVKCLQRCLNGSGYNCGTVDGDFGDKTKNAVIALQKDNNIEVDGVAGRQTWSVITGSKQ